MPSASVSEETLVFHTEADTIPPFSPKRERTLVLCFDGTGDTADEDRTNVVELREMLKNFKESEEGQLVYYQEGIGKYTPKIPGIKTPVKIPGITQLFQTWDRATACSLDRHVMAAYLWLVNNYRPKDKICMFGFSRGSYTARAVAGMLFKVGLLPQEHRDHVKAAFASYEAQDTAAQWEKSRDFQQAFGSIDVPIEFLGCWDTVKSVGYMTSKILPFTAYNPMVRTFRHAVALDERRAKFRTNLWSPSNKTLTPGESGLTEKQKTIKRLIDEKSKGLEPTNVDEVWFVGCHCDVGGGSVKNGTKPNLAHISLRWMVRQCFKRETGMMFLKAKLKEFHLEPDSLYPVVRPRPDPVAPKIPKIHPPGLGPIDTAKSWFNYFNPFGSREPKQDLPKPKNEEEADAIDALAPIYDMLDIKPMWRLLENKIQKVYNSKLDKYDDVVYNRKPRGLRGPIFVDSATKLFTKTCVRVHRTVMTRMMARHADGSPYVPKAVFSANKTISLDAGFSGDEANFVWVD